MGYKESLDKIASAYKNILNDNLVGIYVHGSIALGCFNPKISDIDFLVVVNEEPSLKEKEELIKTILNLNDEAPAKGYEMSVVLYKHCKKFVYPTPFVLHYSVAHLKRCTEELEDYCRTMNGCDKDLAAHFTITKNSGYTLCGKPLKEVFGDVPKDDYLDSIKYDVEGAKEQSADDPMYIILNLCRVLAYKNEDLILSKEQGGLWAIRNTPDKYSDEITKALNLYKSKSNEEFDKPMVEDFCDYMSGLIFG